MFKFLRISFLILVPVLVAIAVYRFLALAILTPVDANDTVPVFVEVAPKKTFRSVAQDLQEKRLVRFWWSLEILGRLSGGSAVINTGEYELNRAMNAKEILKKLTSGDIYKRRVTIKEGTSIWAIGQLLDDAGLAVKDAFSKLVTDTPFITSLGINEQSLEGYLFPETYFFSKPIDAQRIIRMMFDQSVRNWPKHFANQAEELHYSRHEILTLASIIEKESGLVAEQPVISSVFHNRLKQGMKLQADPTVIYGIPNFNGNLTKADLERPSPYNTYVNYGLPPGPITNPGKSAIEAALFPAKTEFLYFVADKKGGHHFSVTLAEHNKAVARYQLDGQ
jgi:UPF0755 protein